VSFTQASIAASTIAPESSNKCGIDIVADQSHFGGNVEFVPGSQVRIGISPAQVRLLPG
jgi:hypothetical protein